MELGRDDRRTGLSVTDDLTKATLTVVWVIILNKPFFLAIPFLAKKSHLAERLALPLVGTLDTLFETAIFGHASGTEFFFAAALRPKFGPPDAATGIRLERRLCEEVHLNLAYRWFCRLGLNGKVPDHSSFSKNRHGRFQQSDILRHMFETVVERCLAQGLVGGEGFAVDASLIAADANKAAFGTRS